MTIPVVYSVAKTCPEDSFTVLTQAFLTTLFINKPDNLNVIGINIRGQEKSFFGLLRYAFRLRKYQFDKVLDLHGVWRSWLMDAVFFLSGKKIVIINKGRKERKQLIARPPKEIRPLRPVTERYADVFHKAGFRFEMDFVSLFENKPDFPEEKSGKWVGIAPFAKHRGKMYPPEKMELIVKKLSGKEDITIFLFGGRGWESEQLQQWAVKYPNVRNVAGLYSLDNELVLMSRLDALVSMDSANMHFASLAGTTVISIWGATHPFAGFYGYRQNPDNAIQEDLSCRPCSVFGNKPCYRGDYACMNNIAPDAVFEKILAIIQ
jgi:ADP-heptose:LPS heptosyltransferase